MTMVGVIVFSAKLLTNAKLEWVPSHYNKKFVVEKSWTQMLVIYGVYLRELLWSYKF